MEWIQSVGNGISQVATDLGSKIDKLAEDYEVKKKLDAVADSAEERFAIASGAYRKLVIAYLTDLANGLTPAAETIHENYQFTDGINGQQGRDFILADQTGRSCVGTVQLFDDGASFGFKMVQTISIEVQEGAKAGKPVRLENVTTFGLVSCAEGKILSHQQRGDNVSEMLAKAQ